jgi:fatty-acyl-CoA synthase
MMETGPTDRMYNCLPMYHSVGGAVATGAVLVNGGSVVMCSPAGGGRAADADQIVLRQAFQQRFRIPQIVEFYPATEGNIRLFNIDGRPGAIGWIPPFLAHRWR